MTAKKRDKCDDRKKVLMFFAGLWAFTTFYNILSSESICNVVWQKLIQQVAQNFDGLEHYGYILSAWQLKDFLKSVKTICPKNWCSEEYP